MTAAPSPTPQPAEPAPGAGTVGTTRLLRPAFLVAATLAAATVLGLIEASQVQYDRALQGEPITWSHALIHGLPRWYAWAAIAPLVIAFTRWLHDRRLGRGLTVLVHVPAGAVTSALQVVILALISSLLHGRTDLAAQFPPALLKYMGLTYLGNLLAYGLMVGGWYGVLLARRYRERESEAARLEVQASELKALLAEARLQRLQSQLEPHFLFNSLHSLSALMLQGDSTRAIRTLRRLSDLLRRTLQAGERTEHALDDELELVRDYLEIQRLRFEDRLDARIEVEPGAGSARVPALLLQPLIENAIRHGIEADPGARKLEVRVMRRTDRPDDLRIEVQNEGPPLGESPRRGAGLGLENTRSRLDALYGGRAGLEIRDVPGGVEVELYLPYRDASAPTTRAAAHR